jgi:hypothetical protein
MSGSSSSFTLLPTPASHSFTISLIHPTPISEPLLDSLLLTVSLLGVIFLATAVKLLRIALTMLFDVLRLALVILRIFVIFAGKYEQVLEVKADVWFVEMKGELLEEA